MLQQPRINNSNSWRLKQKLENFQFVRNTFDQTFSLTSYSLSLSLSLSLSQKYWLFTCKFTPESLRSIFSKCTLPICHWQQTQVNLITYGLEAVKHFNPNLTFLEKLFKNEQKFYRFFFIFLSLFLPHLQFFFFLFTWF